MFLLDKNNELTLAKVGDIIQTFNIRDKAKLQRYYDYYKGNQEIMRKYYTDTTKPCNRIVTNYCYNIVQNYLGYLTGQEVASAIVLFTSAIFVSTFVRSVFASVYPLLAHVSASLANVSLS